MSMGEVIQGPRQAPTVANGGGVTTGAIIVNPDGSQTYQGAQQATSSMTGVLPRHMQSRHETDGGGLMLLGTFLLVGAGIYWVAMAAHSGKVIDAGHGGHKIFLAALIGGILCIWLNGVLNGG